MQYVPGFVWEVLSTGAVSASLLAFFGWIFKGQIGHWLSKDIERLKNQFQKELEAEKASHLHALEAYKVSLIAEAERAKASQAVKTAVAVKFSEHQFTAIADINRSVAGLASHACALYELALFCLKRNEASYWNDFEQRKDAVVGLIDVCRGHISSARLYLSAADAQQIHHFESVVSGILVIAGRMRIQALGEAYFQIDLPQVGEFLKFTTADERLAYMNMREEKMLKVLQDNAIRHLEMKQ